MNRTSTDQMQGLHEERRQVETYCQSLVSAGAAQWRINESGDTELHLKSGEAFLFGNVGVTRLK